MKNEEKKGLFQRLIGGNKAKKGSCCNIQLEEITTDKKDKSRDPSKSKDN